MECVSILIPLNSLIEGIDKYQIMSYAHFMFDPSRWHDLYMLFPPEKLQKQHRRKTLERKV